MSQKLANFPIRIACDSESLSALADARTNNGLAAPRGATWEFQLGLFSNQVIIADKTDLAQIVIQLRPTGPDGSAPNPDTTAPVLQKIIASADVDATVTGDNWTARAAQNVDSLASPTDTDLAAGNYWLSIFAVMSDDRVQPLGEAPFVIYQAGGAAPIGTPAPITPFVAIDPNGPNLQFGLADIGMDDTELTITFNGDGFVSAPRIILPILKKPAPDADDIQVLGLKSVSATQAVFGLSAAPGAAGYEVMWLAFL